MAKEIEISDEKQSWLDKFANQRSDYFFPETWPTEDIERAKGVVTEDKIKMSMFAGIPMQCKGERCQLAKVCPLLEMGLAPVGKRCPIETRMVQQLSRSLMKSLRVDEEDLVEVCQIKDLVNEEVKGWRATQVLAYEDFIQESVVGFNERTGEPVFKKDVHAAAVLQDRILKNKSQIRKEMLASRNERAKVGIGAIDTATAVATAMSQLREIDAQNKKVVDRKLRMLAAEDEDITDAEIVEDNDDGDTAVE